MQPIALVAPVASLDSLPAPTHCALRPLRPPPARASVAPLTSLSSFSPRAPAILFPFQLYCLCILFLTLTLASVFHLIFMFYNSLTFLSPTLSFIWSFIKLLAIQLHFSRIRNFTSFLTSPSPSNPSPPPLSSPSEERAASAGGPSGGYVPGRGTQAWQSSGVSVGGEEGRERGGGRWKVLRRGKG